MVNAAAGGRTPGHPETILQPAAQRISTGGANLERASGEGNAGLVEPLSERELEVLQLLAEGCTNREIG